MRAHIGGGAVTLPGQDRNELFVSQGPERHASGVASPETHGFPSKTQGFGAKTQGLSPAGQQLGPRYAYRATALGRAKP